MEEDDIRRSFRLDRKTDKLLQKLANRHGGNMSECVRELVKAEAGRSGLLPVTSDRPRPAHHASQGI